MSLMGLFRGFLAAASVLAVPAMLSVPARATDAGTERMALAIDAFTAGTTLSPAETAVVVAEDGADRRANPALAASNDRAAATFMVRLRRASPALRAQYREELMNGLFATPHGFPDPQQKAIIARHNPVLAIGPASHQVLTLRSVAGAINQMQQMAAFQGRPPLDEPTIRRAAAALPAQFRAANSTEQRYLAFAESDAIQLRSVLARQTPAERARYRRTASVGPVTPGMLRQAAVGTLQIAARGRSGIPPRGSMGAYGRALGQLTFSPFIPHL